MLLSSISETSTRLFVLRSRFFDFSENPSINIREDGCCTSPYRLTTICRWHNEFRMHENNLGELIMNTDFVHHWFASNCDWRGSVEGKPKPVKLSCIPIGIENRYNKIGGDPKRYVDAMDFPMDRKDMLYVSFKEHMLKPQRAEVLHYMKSLGVETTNWATYNPHIATWEEFAQVVRSHNFVLCPHGHGLSTHRLWEVLLLGSIPVVKASTLDSIYEGLPVVILKEWNELTEDRLKAEWDQISQSEYELDKIFWPYWENLVRVEMDEAQSTSIGIQERKVNIMVGSPIVAAKETVASGKLG